MDVQKRMDERDRQRGRLAGVFPGPKKESKKKGMMSRASVKVRNWIRKMMRVGAADSTEADPAIVKAQIPRAWFTKKGPGRLREARRVYANMTPEQREIAISRGWLPREFAQLSKNALKRLAR